MTTEDQDRLPAVVPRPPNDLFWEMAWTESPDLTVVRVSLDKTGSFSPTVRREFSRRWPGRLRFVTVDLTEIDHKNDMVRDWILKWRAQLGWPASTNVPAGYYLFRKHFVLAYGDASPSKEEEEAAFESVVSAGSDRMYEAFRAAARKRAASRVVTGLVHALETLEAREAAAKAEEERKAEAARAEEERKKAATAKMWADAIEKWKADNERKRLAALREPLTLKDREAIRLLGVPEDYTPEELRAAKRTAQKKVHPDVSKLSPAEATRRSAVLNAAYDTLNDRFVT